jgi:hypothetical protein
MDIHKPKPWHGLREFLKEYLIIVVGVLTALGAEQVIQAVDWQRRVADAERGFHAELTDNASNAFSRLATVRCATAQFDAIRHALIENRERGTPVPELPAYKRGNRLLYVDSWESARALQLTGHLPTERASLYSKAYSLAASYRDWQRKEQDLKSGVDTLSDNAGRLTAQERDRLFLALHDLEEHSNWIDLVAFRYLEATRPLGVTIDPKLRRGIIEGYRRRDGLQGASCAQDPSPWLNDGDKAVDWLLNRKGEP